MTTDEDPFWLRPVATWTEAKLASFLDEEIPEGLHLEYKGPASTPPRHLGPDVLPSVAAMANTAGGLIICGVLPKDDEQAKDLPGRRVGIAMKRPDESLRNMAAAGIEPLLGLQMKVLKNEDDPETTLLLVKVPVGPNPPYNLRNRGVFCRVGEADRAATNRDLEELFERRRVMGPPPKSQYDLAYEKTLTLPSTNVRGRPYLTVVLAPEQAAPNRTIPQWPDDADDAFGRICSQLLGPNLSLVSSPDGIMHAPFLHDRDDPGVSFACGFSGGAIGMRRPAFLIGYGLGSVPAPAASEPLRVSFIQLWQDLRHMLCVAQAWPRSLVAESDLHYLIGVGGMSGASLELGLEGFSGETSSARVALANLGTAGWSETGIWSGQGAHAVVDAHIQSLARQFQLFSFGRSHVRSQVEQVIGP